MPLEPYEIPDENWRLFRLLVTVKVEENQITDIEQIFRIFKRFWLLITDLPEMQRVSDRHNLNKLIALRDKQDADRASIDAEITRLEDELAAARAAARA